jgi:phosphoribosylamine--glycine ligase
MKKVENRIIMPTINGLRSDEIPFKGFIFFGLIYVDGEPYVIEYNVRLGDPETEAVILRIKSDLVDLLEGVANGDLAGKTIEIDSRSSVTVMLVSDGYPGNYEKGKAISETEKIAGSIVFHAGTKMLDGKVVTNGGRVLSVSSVGRNFREALDISYKNIKKIQFENMYYRNDIGYDL